MSTYKNAMNKTVLSDEKKNQLKSLYNQGSVIKFKKKKTFVKPVSIIAASLALVIALGAVFTFGTKDKSSFVMTVNAEEISKDKSAYIELDEKNTEYGMSIHYDGNVIGSFPVYVGCKGEDIETVTYSIDRGALLTSTRINDNKIVDGIIAPKDDYNNGISINGENSIARAYYSFTVGYKDQPDSFEYTTKNEIKSDFLMSAVINNKDLPQENQKEIKKYANLCQNSSGDVFEKSFHKLLSKLYDGTRITLTAKYKDGTEKSQTVELSVKKMPNESEKDPNVFDNVIYLELKLV